MISRLISIIINIISSGTYIFKSSKVKLDRLNNDNISLREKTKIVKSLLPKNKKEQLKILFDFRNNPDIFDDGIKLFYSLTYQDKITALDTMKYDTYKEQLIRNMSHISIVKTLRTGYDLDLESRKYMISLLTPIEKKIVYRTTFLISSQDKTELLKYYPKEKIKNVLRRKPFTFGSLTDSYKIELLMSLSSDEEKLKIFNVPNEYNLDISYYDKLKVLTSLSDSKKLEFINGKWDNLIELNNYKKCDLVKSLSDEAKMYYLDNPEEFSELFKYSENDFFNSFSELYSKKILINRNNYQYELSGDNAVTLINNLDIRERLEFLESGNKYNIDLNIDQKCNIIRKLPNKYKLEIINNKSIYDLDLEEEHITKIIKSMDGLSIINILIANENIKTSLTKESIWNIIENLDILDVDKILKSNDIRVKNFIEKYKTSFVKCLTTDDKIKIICNKSEYNIQLDDSRKLKILKSINPYSGLDEALFGNIFNYFDNPKTIVNCLINNKREFDKLHELFQTELVMYFMDTEINNDDVEIGIDIIKYTTNAESILTRYSSFRYIFKKLNISIYDFFQYGSNSNKYNWYESIINILDNNTLDSFSNVKDYFFNNYYNISGDSKDIISKFLEMLDVYNKYKEFCINLTNENRKLSKEEKEDIRYLFNQSSIENIPTRLEEVANIRNEKIKSYILVAQNSNNLSELKEALFNLLFDKSFDEIIRIINYTGGTEELKILKFNNRNNKEINEVADNLILVTSLIERIINTNDVDGLKKKLAYFSSENNLEHTKRLFNYCSKYEEFNRKLYEYDMNASLTSIHEIDHKLYNTDEAIECHKKYGGKVIDLSKVQYVLGAHVKSSREKIEDLLFGHSDGKSNFICLSPVSHRGQHYYAWGDSRTVFAYDNIPSDSFICSSISNMGSNWNLEYNSAEVPIISRTQKNILETSEASTGHNAEILLYRQGLKPCGIIIPIGTNPSDEAIEYHKKYDLPFIITQPLDKRIDNPIRLDHNEKKLNINSTSDIESLQELKNALINNNKNKMRSIAILADPHALYEPTLACLVDMKNKGIDEIYSLGDNIGHGPNPKEVLELLDEYGVKSIYGNHELYLIDGIELFREHFPGEEAINRTQIMNKWIKDELTEKQIEDIKKYPERYEINMPKNKKITLIHTNRAYNVVGKYSNRPTIDKSSIVIRGHEHFAGGSLNDIVLRGVGIGQTSEDDGYAVYYIVNIIDDKYDIETIKIPYDRDNLLHTINESNMPVLAKGLITDWVGNKKQS